MKAKDGARRVLNISKNDAIGRRFNNLDAGPRLEQFGWHAQNCCWTERCGPPERSVRIPGSFNRRITRILGKLGAVTGNLDGYYRNAGSIKSLPQYREADLLHFHIVHEKWLSLHDLRSLARNKPVVWTWHDPYMTTGHCIHSMGCPGFESGCPRCPHLDYYMPILRDRSRENLAEKLDTVRKIDPLVIIASNYMKELIGRSVYGNSIRTKIIPFGIEFGMPPALDEAKQRLGIDKNHVVFGFRADYSAFKGAALIVEAFTHMAAQDNLPVTVIAFHEKGMCRAFSDKIKVVETGWVGDGKIQDYYAAMDYFLMPSKAESFGLMAVESLAAGVCPIVTYGTALPELINAPVHGIAVEHTALAVQNAILSAIKDVNSRRMARNQRIDFANTAYGIGRFCRELAGAYDEEIEYRARH